MSDRKNTEHLSENVFGADVLAVTTGPNLCVVKRRQHVKVTTVRDHRGDRHGDKHLNDSVQAQVKAGGHRVPIEEEHAGEDRKIPGTGLPMMT